MGILFSLIWLNAAFASQPHYAHFEPKLGYTAEEITMLEKAEVAMNSVIASECFEDFMLHRDLVETEGRTPEQVIYHIRSQNLTVPVIMYYKNNRTVGYRVPPDTTIYTNRKFHARFDVCGRASNLGHEWLHILGYGHDSRNTSRRPYSVPYSFNAAVAVCCPLIE